MREGALAPVQRHTGALPYLPLIILAQPYGQKKCAVSYGEGGGGREWVHSDIRHSERVPRLRR